MNEDQERAIRQMYEMLMAGGFERFENKLYFGPLNIGNVSDVSDFVCFFRPKK